MKLTKTTSLLMVAALVITGMSFVLAQKGPGQWGGPPPGVAPGGPEMEPGFGFNPRMMRFLGRALGLTDEQKEEIHALLVQQRDLRHEQGPQNFEALQEIQKQIREVTAAESFDAARLRTLYQQRSEILEEGFVRQHQLMHDIFQVLTEEQQQKAMELLDEGRPGRFEHRGPRAE